MLRRTFKARRDGRFDVRLGAAERNLLRSLVPQVSEMLLADESSAAHDPVVGRLFPVAYPEERDADRQTEYRLLVHDELRASHLAALSTLAETAEADAVNAAQLGAWVRAVNGIRLVLGTRLDVSEEGDERPDGADDPRADGFAVYDFLSWLTDEMVEAMSPSVQPAEGDARDDLEAIESPSPEDDPGP